MDKKKTNEQVDVNQANLSAYHGILSDSLGAINTSQIVTGNGQIALDLVVVIDTSGSMSDEAGDLSKQIDATIEAASAKCPSHLRATFLGIEGTWANTKFDQSASEYLIKIGANERDLQDYRLKNPMGEIMLEIKKIYVVRLLILVNTLIGEMMRVGLFLCWVMKGWKVAVEFLLVLRLQKIMKPYLSLKKEELRCIPTKVHRMIAQQI